MSNQKENKTVDPISAILNELDQVTITLRSIYKDKPIHFQPLKMRNGLNHPFVKKVRYDDTGHPEMILSEKERDSEYAQFFIPEDEEIIVSEGTTFDLRDPRQAFRWLAIKDSELIVPTRDARDDDGNLLIDGDKQKYGRAELWIDIPGEESQKNVSRRKLITKAWTFIENDSVEGRLTKIKLLGKVMRNAPDSDIQDFLYQKAEKDPNSIIELYTSSDIALRLLLIEAKERHIITKPGNKGMFMYSDTILGGSDDAVIMYLKDPTNQKILQSIKRETFPDMVQKIEGKEQE